MLLREVPRLRPFCKGGLEQRCDIVRAVNTHRFTTGDLIPTPRGRS